MSEHMRAIIAILLVDVFWGLNTIFSKIALEEVPVTLWLGVRSVFAAIFLGFMFRKSFVRPPKKLLLFALLGGPVSFWGIWKGIELSSAQTVALVGSLDPSVYFFLSMALLHEKFNLKKFVGVVFAVIGVGIGATGAQSVGGDAPWWGPLMYLGFFAGGTLVTIMMKKYIADKPHIQPPFIAWLYLAANSLLLLPYAIFSGEQLVPEAISTQTVLIWTYSMTSLVIAFGVLYFYAVKRIDGEDIGLFRSLEPVVIALGGIFILGEVFTWQFGVGALFVAVGLAIAELHIHPYRIFRHIKRH